MTDPDLKWMDSLKTEGFASAHRIALSKNEPKDARYRYYRDEWVRRPREFDPGNFPINLDFEVNADCNLFCPMCFRQTGVLPKGEMPTTLFEKMLDEASQYPDDWMSAKFNFRGESTLTRNLADYCRTAKRYGAVETILNTNGNFPQEMLPGLMSGLDVIAFSLDAATPQTYKKIRVGGDFKTATDNVDLAIALRDTYGYKTRVRVSFVHQILNDAEVEDFITYWKNRGIDAVTVNLCFNPGMANDRVKYQSPYIIEQDPDFICAQPWQRLMIMANGNVVPCCGDWKGSYKLGNTTSDKLYDIWHGKRMAKLRELNQTHQYMKMPICATCGVSQNKVGRPRGKSDA